MIRDAQPSEVATCKFVGRVQGSSGWGGVAACDKGRANAMNEAREEAAKRHGTHITWSNVSCGGGGAVAEAEVFDCGAPSTQQTAVSEATRYCEGLMANKGLDPIRGKFPLSLQSREVAFEMLSNTAKVTEEEKQALVVYVELRIQCHQRQRDLLTVSFGPPPIWTIHARERATAALASLYAGTTSYAEFNRELQEIAAAADKEQADVQFRQRMLSAAEAQQETAERARLDQQYFNALQAWQRSLPRPEIKCTSQAVAPGTVSTRCSE
jgi:hypothetical protein